MNESLCDDFQSILIHSQVNENLRGTEAVVDGKDEVEHISVNV